MTPNQITALRVTMAFAAVALFGLAPGGILGHSAWMDVTALGLTVGAIALDAVDGWLARRKKLATPLGAQFDILGDRVIENVFFTFFAVTGLASWWLPVFFFVRGTLTDFLRGLAAQSGKSGFGKNSMLESWWGRALVASRASRAAYGALKCVCFCYLGLELTLQRGATATWASGGTPQTSALLGANVAPLQLGGEILVGATVAFCLVRALPVLWEGRKYLTSLEPALSVRPRAPSVRGRLGGAARGLSLPHGVAGR